MSKPTPLRGPAAALIPILSCAQPAAEPEQPIDVFQMPARAESVAPNYPFAALREGKEGWVRLNFMVDPEGRAYEIEVLDQAGDEAFVRAAQRAVQETSYSPAMVGDRAVDGSMTMVYHFLLEDAPRVARRDFAGRYRRFLRALNEESRDEAASELASLEQLDVHNNYEYAYVSLARYNFASRYGTALEQMSHLENALSETADHPEYGSFLPEELVTPSRRALFQLDRDSDTQYSVAEDAGDCSMEATGAPGTTFNLVQL